MSRFVFWIRRWPRGLRVLSLLNSSARTEYFCAAYYVIPIPLSVKVKVTTLAKAARAYQKHFCIASNTHNTRKVLPNTSINSLGRKHNCIMDIPMFMIQSNDVNGWFWPLTWQNQLIRATYRAWLSGCGQGGSPTQTVQSAPQFSGGWWYIAHVNGDGSFLENVTLKSRRRIHFLPLHDGR